LIDCYVVAGSARSYNATSTSICRDAPLFFLRSAACPDSTPAGISCCRHKTLRWYTAVVSGDRSTYHPGDSALAYISRMIHAWLPTSTVEALCGSQSISTSTDLLALSTGCDVLFGGPVDGSAAHAAVGGSLNSFARAALAHKWCLTFPRNPVLPATRLISIAARPQWRFSLRMLTAS
jgi:hypothetical protein